MTTLSAPACSGPVRGPWRIGFAGVALTMATGLLVAMTWALARVVWFVHSSAYCATTTCTGSGMAATRFDTDLMVQGEEAFRASGASDLTIVLSYLPVTAMALAVVVALLIVASLVWWSPSTWVRHWRAGSARGPVLVAQTFLAGLAVFVLLYVVNWQTMLWITHVTD